MCKRMIQRTFENALEKADKQVSMKSTVILCDPYVVSNYLITTRSPNSTIDIVRVDELISSLF